MNDEQMIQESAARLFANAAKDLALNERVEAGEFPQALWGQVAQAGFQLALVSGEQGFGLSAHQALPIFTELGRHRIPLPLAETAIGLALLDAAGQALPTGPGTIIECRAGTQLHLSDDQATISGHAQAVPWARCAQWAVVQLQSGALAYVDMGEEGVRVEPSRNTAGLPSDKVVLESVPVRAVLPSDAFTANEPMRLLGALVHTAMMVGAMEWVLEQTIEYANDRAQFGRPIGKYQALQQALAQLAGDVAAARIAVLVAAHDFQLADRAYQQRGFFSIAVAKVRCGEAGSHAAAVAHQILGAIGFTREHALHTATRRLWVWRETHGADAWWAQRLGEMAIGAGASAFWNTITQRQFLDAASV